MQQFSVTVKNTRAQLRAQENYIETLAGIEEEVRHVRLFLSFEVKSKADIQARLGRAAREVGACRAAMGALHTGLDKALARYEAAEQRVMDNATPEKFDTGLLWKAVGAFGPAGKLVSTVGKFFTSDKQPAAKWSEGAKGLWEFSWKVSDAAKACAESPNVKWWQAAVGGNQDKVLKELAGSGLGPGDRAKAGWAKSWKKTGGKFGTAKGIVREAGGLVLTAVGKGVGNYAEYQTGAISAERAVAETVMETAVDWGKMLPLAPLSRRVLRRQGLRRRFLRWDWRQWPCPQPPTGPARG